MTVLEDILDVNGLEWEITIWLLLLVEQRLYISPASLLRLNLCCIECTSSEGSVVFIFHFHPLIAITFFFILSCPLGKIKGKLIHFKMYVFRRTAEKGQQLSFGCNDYLFGNAVNIKNRFSFAKKENSALSEHTCLTIYIIGWDNSKNNTTNRCTNIEIF